MFSHRDRKHENEIMTKESKSKVKLMHVTHAVNLCLLLMQLTCACYSCSYLMHVTHAVILCTLLMQLSYARYSCSYLMHVTHAVILCMNYKFYGYTMY